jgi:ferredoxin
MAPYSDVLIQWINIANTFCLLGNLLSPVPEFSQKTGVWFNGKFRERFVGSGVPAFDREKCVHCGACLRNCSQATPKKPERMNITFRAGTGGLLLAVN